LTDASTAEDTTPAQKHGAGRADTGFTVAQMIAEFRALRASVLRLWTAQGGTPSATHLDEVTRFNEAIDQAVAESLVRYMEDLDRARDRFLSILGHDLVTPLDAIWTSARVMLDHGELREPNLTLVRGINSSATRMNTLVGDLLDFTRTRFGDAMPIVRVETDAAQVIEDAVAEARAANPERVVRTELSGDLKGRWDADRVAQMLVNLLRNAIEHGADDTPVRVTARGMADEIEISVHNEGAILQQQEVRELFQVMKASTGGRARGRRHLGLGLYIVDNIVRAHQGTIAVDSAQGRGTTLTVRLPREAQSMTTSGVDAADTAKA
jgi:signal transduction histidine kinase